MEVLNVERELIHKLSLVYSVLLLEGVLLGCKVEVRSVLEVCEEVGIVEYSHVDDKPHPRKLEGEEVPAEILG